MSANSRSRMHCLINRSIGTIINYETVLSTKDLQMVNLQTLVGHSISEIDAIKQQISNLQDSEVANLTNQIAEKDAKMPTR